MTRNRVPDQSLATSRAQREEQRKSRRDLVDGAITQVMEHLPRPTQLSSEELYLRNLGIKTFVGDLLVGRQISEVNPEHFVTECIVQLNLRAEKLTKEAHGTPR